MPLWNPPHITKVYEALGAIADGRVIMKSEGGNVRSSSGNKSYTVSLDTAEKAIMSDDNTCYYTDSLSYPCITILMLHGLLPSSTQWDKGLRGIAWKDINHSLQNDFDELQVIVDARLREQGLDVEALHTFSEALLWEIQARPWKQLWEKRSPSPLY